MLVKTLIATLVITAISACSNAPQKNTMTAEQLASSKGYLLGKQVDSINEFKFNGWNYISSKAITINTSPSSHYLVTLKDSCHELSSTEVIGTTATGSFMRAGFDAVVVKQSGLGTTRKCYVDKIYQISKQAKDKNA